MDAQVQRRLKLIRESGGRVDTTIALSVARAISKVRNPQTAQPHLERGWARSLFKRMGFTQRAATTGKLRLPELYVKEKSFTFLNSIGKYAKEGDIPNSMIINWDQTPINYVPANKYTMAAKGSSKVDMAGLSEK